MLGFLSLIVLCSWIGATATESNVNLPFGDVNVVVLTDVHSWVGGHGAHEPGLDANYGNILSFYERLKELEPNRDIFFVMNGDFMDGTGLSTDPPTHLTPILRFMPWDALNIGNHELYDNTNVEYITQDGGFVDQWNGRYLTSNVLLSETSEPIGNRFTYLKGSNLGSTVLTFGFLYNFWGHCNSTQVEAVEEVVRAQWFVDELSTGEYDAILVLAHMDVKDDLVYVILDGIRNVTGPDVPVQFITGHTHYRANEVLDNRASSFMAGRYLDTLGFVSFPLTQNLTVNETANFQHVFMDANVQTLKDTLGVDEMSTSSGSALSSLIHETQKDLGLFDIVGCSPHRFYLRRNLEEQYSLWALYLYEVVMHGFFHYNQSSVLVQSTEAFRYDLMDGNLSRDDLIAVSPFRDSIWKVSERTRGADILLALGLLGQGPNYLGLPSWVLSGAILPDGYYDLFTESVSIAAVRLALQNVSNAEPSFEPIQVYRNGVAVTTTSLWFDYVSAFWSCDMPAGVQTTNRWLLVGISAIGAAAIFGWKFYWANAARRHRRQGYDDAVALQDDDCDEMIL